VRHERPSDYAAAEKRKEFPPPHGFAPGPRIAEQGYLNIKGYKEFAAQNRPDGWNAWVTLVISPAEQTATVPPRRMIAK
jgi:hypothetical protein